MNIVIRTDATNYGSTVPMVRTFTVFAGTYAQCAAYIRKAAYTMRQKCENEGSLISACSPRSNRSALREVVHYGGSLKNKIQTRWDVATSHMVAKEEELDGFSINNVHKYVYVIDGESHLKLEIFSSKKRFARLPSAKKHCPATPGSLTLIEGQPFFQNFPKAKIFEKVSKTLKKAICPSTCALRVWRSIFSRQNLTNCHSEFAVFTAS